MFFETAGRLRRRAPPVFLVVLDPPAFAKSRHNLEAAVTGLSGDKPARLALAGAGRNPGHVFLLRTI